MPGLPATVDIPLSTDPSGAIRVSGTRVLLDVANPIISFNIEPFSTILLARPTAPVRMVFQTRKDNATVMWSESSGKFQRLAYHPHGLVTADMVMTASQYASSKQTLAFGLAIHACFGSTLAIVGMILEDEYLREHIERYRASIGWFNSHFPAQISE